MVDQNHPPELQLPGERLEAMTVTRSEERYYYYYYYAGDGMS